MKNAAWFIVASFLASAPVCAQSDAFPFGDPKLGKQVVEGKCSGCHVARFGGDGSAMFRAAPTPVVF